MAIDSVETVSTVQSVMIVSTSTPSGAMPPSSIIRARIGTPANTR